MKYILTILCFFPFILGCNNASIDNTSITKSFSRNDFDSTYSLKPIQKIELTEALNPYYCYLVKDSLILLTNRDEVQEYKAGIYSLASGKLIKEFGHKGNGPKEFIDCSLDVRTNDSDIFYMEDAIQNKYWICSIDSLLEDKEFQLKEFTYSRDVIRLCPMENKYIGYNFWYIKEKQYANKVAKLQEYPMVSGPKGRLGTGHNYFVANVTGGYVFTNPANNDIWVADFYDAKIDIYNDSLNLTKSLIGPDKFEHQYNLVEEDEFKYIYFFKGKSYRGYLCYTLTQEHVYLVYEGTNGTPYRTTNLKNVEVFKLDWNGNLICNYQLDKHAFAISVDSKEQYLYACCFDSYDSEIEFVKYALK